MIIQDTLFYVFSIITIVSSLFVITLSHPVKAVFCLIITFMSVAGLWMLLEAEFLSILLLLVYVGAVLVLFLFVVMMLNLKEYQHQKTMTQYLPISICVSVWLILGLVVANGPKSFGLDKIALIPYPSDFNHLEALATLLYSDYLYPIEIASIILLVAMVSAITLTLTKKVNQKLDSSTQIEAKKSDRLKLVRITQDSAISRSDLVGEEK